jgi:hypothetical protein
VNEPQWAAEQAQWKQDILDHKKQWASDDSCPPCASASVSAAASLPWWGKQSESDNNKKNEDKWWEPWEPQETQEPQGVQHAELQLFKDQVKDRHTQLERQIGKAIKLEEPVEQLQRKAAMAEGIAEVAGQAQLKAQKRIEKLEENVAFEHDVAASMMGRLMKLEAFQQAILQDLVPTVSDLVSTVSGPPGLEQSREAQVRDLEPNDDVATHCEPNDLEPNEDLSSP